MTPDVELEAVAEEMLRLKGRLLCLAVDLPPRSLTLPLVHSVAARLVIDYARLNAEARRRRREDG